MDNKQLALDFVMHTNPNLFVTGKAGTGKTTFLRQLKEITQKQMAVVAPTGVAAVNAGGTTIHSFFQLPITPFLPTSEGRSDLIGRTKMRGDRRRVLQELELLVIDEISMVRADLLDAIDVILRHFRCREEPFGGVQLLFIGDLFQLPPVAKEEEWRLLSGYYQSPYFFHSFVAAEAPPLYIEFEKIYRQTHSDFIGILNEIRHDCLSGESLRMLEQHYIPHFVPPSDENYIILTTHNQKADLINGRKLEEIKGKNHPLKAEIEGEYPERNNPTDLVLDLKIGARVMFLKNDTETPRRFYNGKIGVVKQIKKGRITVCCEGDEPVEVEPAVWENIGYSVNPESRQIEEKILGRFVQFPLRLAWAITIHKSQGLTFDKAVIDAGHAFAPGQVYVALSRCRSLEGVVLLSRINPVSIHNDRQVVAYERDKQPVAMLEEQLSYSRKAYYRDILLSFFDFSGLSMQSKLLSARIDELQASFNKETIPYLQQVRQLLQEMDEVAVKFRLQLITVFKQYPLREEYLQSRISAACGFFAQRAGQFLEILRKSPVSTDSRTNAGEYNEAIQQMFSDMAMKKHIIESLISDSPIEAYFAARSRFSLPHFSVNAYARSASATSDLSYPELYRLLLEERNRICEPKDLPIYLVAGSKTLYEMAEYLPQDKKELLQISGFGSIKVEKYGEIFLSIIRLYSKKHGLQSRLSERISKKR